MVYMSYYWCVPDWGFVFEGVGLSKKVEITEFGAKVITWKKATHYHQITRKFTHLEYKFQFEYISIKYNECIVCESDKIRCQEIDTE